MPEIRPFRFNLPRFSRAQAAMLESFSLHLGERPLSRNFKQQLLGVLSKYLKSPFELGEIEHRPIRARELSAILPAVGCFVCVGAGPSEHKIWAEIDATLAHFAVERLLGGQGTGIRVQRPLTAIEEGVFSFVVLHILEQFQGGLKTGRELALSLDQFASTPEEIRSTVSPENSFQLLSARLATGQTVGYVRILIPDALLSARFGAPKTQGRPTDLELAYMRRVLGGLADLETTCRVRVAELDLGPADLGNLEPGDIVVIDNHQISRQGDAFTGSVLVSVGSGEHGRFRARWLTEDGRSRLQVEEIVLEEKPSEVAMVENEEARQDESEVAEPHDGHDAADDHIEQAAAPELQGEPADNLPETEGLLRNVDAPVAVELGRIRLNTAQIARLRRGQILRMPRGANDPVDLVVGGKLFGRGELIEVDGELGVRIVQVVGAG